MGSINLFVPFKLVTRLVFWDDRSLYFEQRFVSLQDNFVRAVSLCKNTVVGADNAVQQMMEDLGHPSPPPCPEEVKIWIQSQELSSSQLRKEKVPQPEEGEGTAKTASGQMSSLNKKLTNEVIKSKGL